MILLRRIEGVETKAQELWVLMEKAGGKGFLTKRGGGGLDEDSLAELKSINQGLTALKV